MKLLKFIKGSVLWLYQSNKYSAQNLIYEAEKRASINMPIQGSASELIKVAMINISLRTEI